MNCHCPAFFHNVDMEQLTFPEDLASLMSSNNITAADLNFNCVLAAFLIKDEEKHIQNVSEV